MSGSPWDSLSDILPKDVRDAVKRARLDALHSGACLDEIERAAITELMRHVVLRDDHDRQVQQVVQHQRATFESGRQAAREAYERGAEAGREAQAALARVSRLLDHRRKTVRMAVLRAAVEGRTEDRDAADSGIARST